MRATVAPLTFLAAGQRYAEPDVPGWRADRQVTIVHVGPGPTGEPRITYRAGGDSQLVVPAADFEAAIADGQLVPVASGGQLAWC